MEAYNNYNKGALLKGQYRKLADLSKGSYGLVSVAEDTFHDNRLVAVKYIYPLPKKGEVQEDDGGEFSDLHPLTISPPSQSILQTLYDEARKEINIHKILGVHSNIATLYDHFDSCLVLEYCSRGDLYDAIQDGKGPSTSQDIKDVFYQILDALLYCHKNNVFHRDLKPENILISEDWSIKLCDWGLATTTRVISNRNEFDVGSERYMAPELFDPEVAKYDAAKIDLWSIGIILLTLVFHKNPFQIANHSDKRFLQFVLNREALFDIFSSMSGEMFSVLRFCLNIDPTNRDIDSLRNELDSLSYFTIDEEYWESQGDRESEESEESEDLEIGSISNSKSKSKQKSIIADNVNSSELGEAISDQGDEDEYEFEDQNSSSSTSSFTNNPEPQLQQGQEKEERHQIQKVKSNLILPRSTVETLIDSAIEDSPVDSAIDDSPLDSALDSDVTGMPDFPPIPHNHRADALLSKNSSMLPIPIIDISGVPKAGKSSIFRNPRKPFGVASFQSKNDGLGFTVGSGSKNFNREDFFTPKSVFNHYMDKYGEKSYQPPHIRNGNVNHNNHNNNSHNNYHNVRNETTTWKKGGKRRSWKKATIDSDNYESTLGNTTMNGQRLRLRLRVRNSFNGAHMMNNIYPRESHNNKKKAHLFLSTKPKKLFGNGKIGTANGHCGHQLSTQLEQLQQHPQINANNPSYARGKYIPPYLRSPNYSRSPIIEPPVEEIGGLTLDDEDEVFHLEDDFEAPTHNTSQPTQASDLKKFQFQPQPYKPTPGINFKVPTYSVSPSPSTTSTTNATATSERSTPRGRRNSIGQHQRPLSTNFSSMTSNKAFSTISEFVSPLSSNGKYVPPFRRGSHTASSSISSSIAPTISTISSSNANIKGPRNEAIGFGMDDRKRASGYDYRHQIFGNHNIGNPVHNHNIENTSSSVPTGGKSDWFKSYKKDWGDYVNDDADDD